MKTKRKKILCSKLYLP